jgi:cellulose synthase/poly-beta-1,6-N-acetylglucosamine synthase-like glycosyltransferase
MILIACPIQNREWLLEDYLYFLYNLDYSKRDIVIYWIVNNSTDETMNILKAFKREHITEYGDIIIEERNNKDAGVDSRSKTQRRLFTYHWLAELRNMMLNKCVELNCDYLLSSDSDIMLRHDTLNRLIEHKTMVM